MPDLVIGGPPRGGDYFGQDHLIDEIWSHLKKDNVLLTAPRRFGKTGAMYQLLDEPRNNFIPLYIDVEYISSAAGFIVELIAMLIKQRRFLKLTTTAWSRTKKFGRFIRDIPGGIDFGGIKVEIREKTDVQENWLEYGEQIKSLLAKGDRPLLLIIDEFPIMINNILNRDYEEAKQLLHWFRAARTAPDTKTRFVVGGSINLASTLEYRGLIDAINDLVVIKVQPFSEETAGQYIEAVFQSKGIELTKEVSQTILDVVGRPIPYLLVVLLDAVFSKLKISKCDVTPGLVRDVFDNELLEGSTSAAFQHYRSRIDQYYLDLEARAAKEILGILSRAEQPVKKDTLYQV
ncbi:MAG: hypothetical protein L0Y73_04285, partial [Candidatus Aminicenantes bacterium]|nr:hypothetical protein [Candidatus Aminicenantes bacterium]